jgi:hypothetical protein
VAARARAVALRPTDRLLRSGAHRSSVWNSSAPCSRGGVDRDRVSGDFSASIHAFRSGPLSAIHCCRLGVVPSVGA